MPRLIALSLVLIATILQPVFAASTRESFGALLFSDLVVRGRVLSMSITEEVINDVMPMWPSEDPEATIPVGRVRIAVDEVMRGTAEDDTLQFLVYVSVSGVKRNYEPGQQMVVGLVWEPDAMGGLYWMISDRGRFIRLPQGWVQQDGGLLLDDLEGVRAALGVAKPRSVLADADAIVVGRVTDDKLEYRVAPTGAQYAVMIYRLADVEVVKGESIEHVASVFAITGGDYWPDWRENSTFPRGIERGRTYCFFIRRLDDGFAVLRGASGAYEVSAGQLVLPGRNLKVGLTLDEVRSVAEGDR